MLLFWTWCVLLCSLSCNVLGAERIFDSETLGGVALSRDADGFPKKPSPYVEIAADSELSGHVHGLVDVEVGVSALSGATLESAQSFNWIIGIDCRSSPISGGTGTPYTHSHRLSLLAGFGGRHLFERASRAKVDYYSLATGIRLGRYQEDGHTNKKSLTPNTFLDILYGGFQDVGYRRISIEGVHTFESARGLFVGFRVVSPRLSLRRRGEITRGRSDIQIYLGKTFDLQALTGALLSETE